MEINMTSTISNVSSGLPSQREALNLADFYILRKALRWLASEANLPGSVLAKVDVLNAQSCGLSEVDICPFPAWI